MNKNNPYYNNEGYADPTAFYGTKQIVKEEAETERRANELIKVLKFIIRSCGFELIERVKSRTQRQERSSNNGTDSECSIGSI